MVGTMLTRGMLVGLLAAVLSLAFLKIAGEPAVDRAIAFEVALDAAKAKAAHDAAISQGLPAPPEDAEPALVSRPMQAGIGLATGVFVYATAFGGLFALAFAMAYRRMGDFGARATAGLLALSGLVAVYVVPSLKYPANPPSVGEAATIALRAGLYVSMIALSLAAMIAAWMLRGRLVSRLGGWNAALVAAAAYLAAMLVAGLLMPGVNEVPETFPATVLWQFRVASLGAQAIMWATIGLGFGAWMEHSADTDRRPSVRRVAA